MFLLKSLFLFFIFYYFSLYSYFLFIIFSLSFLSPISPRESKSENRACSHQVPNHTRLWSQSKEQNFCLSSTNPNLSQHYKKQPAKHKWGTEKFTKKNLQSKPSVSDNNNIIVNHKTTTSQLTQSQSHNRIGNNNTRGTQTVIRTSRNRTHITKRP